MQRIFEKTTLKTKLEFLFSKLYLCCKYCTKSRAHKSWKKHEETKNRYFCCFLRV